MTDNILITICARGGSKGIPGKNIKILHGKPLIFYTLQVANEWRKKYPQTVIGLSTDCQEIKSVVRSSGFEGIETSYERPEQLATDAAGKVDAIRDVKNYLEGIKKVRFDYVIDLDVTSPLRTLEDLDQAMKMIKEKKQALNLYSVSPASRNPYFNMVELREDGFCKLCKEGTFLSRQAAPEVFELNASFYIYTAAFFDQKNPKVINDKSIMYPLSHMCFDLDHPIDFEFMSYLMEQGKLNFNFLS
jgi:CMP-N-acetylneuraminic acid synthetase